MESEDVGSGQGGFDYYKVSERKVSLRWIKLPHILYNVSQPLSRMLESGEVQLLRGGGLIPY